MKFEYQHGRQYTFKQLKLKMVSNNKIHLLIATKVDQILLQQIYQKFVDYLEDVTQGYLWSLSG